MKKVIRLTESDLVKIIKRIITEQTPILGGSGNMTRPIFDLTKPGIEATKIARTSGKTPGTEMDDDIDFECAYQHWEKIKHFFDEAKTWKYSVDEVFMNKIIDGLKKQLGGYFSGNVSEILRLLSQVKTKAGMGYLVRNFKLNGKNLYDTLDMNKSFPWKFVVDTLKKNFVLPYGPSGCNGYV